MDKKFILTNLILAVKSIDRVHDTLMTPKQTKIAVIGGLSVKVILEPPESEIYSVLKSGSYIIDAIKEICGVESDTEAGDEITNLVCCSDKSAPEIADILIDAYG